MSEETRIAIEAVIDRLQKALDARTKQHAVILLREAVSLFFDAIVDLGRDCGWL